MQYVVNLLYPSGWLLLTIYGALPLIIGIVMIVLNKLKTLPVTLGVGVVLSLSCFITTPIYDDAGLNVSSWDERAIPIAELFFVPLILALIFVSYSALKKINRS